MWAGSPVFEQFTVRFKLFEEIFDLCWCMLYIFPEFDDLSNVLEDRVRHRDSAGKDAEFRHGDAAKA